MSQDTLQDPWLNVSASRPQRPYLWTLYGRATSLKSTSATPLEDPCARAHASTSISVDSRPDERKSTRRYSETPKIRIPTTRERQPPNTKSQKKNLPTTPRRQPPDRKRETDILRGQFRAGETQILTSREAFFRGPAQAKRKFDLRDAFCSDICGFAARWPKIGTALQRDAKHQNSNHTWTSASQYEIAKTETSNHTWMSASQYEMRDWLRWATPNRRRNANFGPRDAFFVALCKDNIPAQIRPQARLSTKSEPWP